MTYLLKFTGRLNGLRGKGDPENCALDIFQDVKILALADNMTDTMLAMTVLAG